MNNFFHDDKPIKTIDKAQLRETLRNGVLKFSHIISEGTYLTFAWPHAFLVWLFPSTNRYYKSHEDEQHETAEGWGIFFSVVWTIGMIAVILCYFLIWRRHV
jgi:Na+/melibiose symporter-like transporter